MLLSCSTTSEAAGGQMQAVEIARARRKEERSYSGEIVAARNIQQAVVIT